MQINRINEENNDLILSEREAWVSSSYTVLLLVAFCLIHVCLCFPNVTDQERSLSLLFNVLGKAVPMRGSTFRRNY